MAYRLGCVVKPLWVAETPRGLLVCSGTNRGLVKQFADRWQDRYAERVVVHEFGKVNLDKCTCPEMEFDGLAFCPVCLHFWDRRRVQENLRDEAPRVELAVWLGTGWPEPLVRY